MAVKRKTAARATPRRVYAAKKKTTRRKNYGYNAIPGAAALAGALMAEKGPLKLFVNEGITKKQSYVNLADRATRPAYLIPAAKNAAIGYVAGYAFKELMPNSGIFGKAKKAVGGIAKKVKVF